MAGDGIAEYTAQGIEIGVVEHRIIKSLLLFLSDAFFLHPYDEVNKQCLLLPVIKIQTVLIGDFFNQQG